MRPRLAPVLALALWGCEVAEPFATLPAPAPPGIDVTLPRVGVCYNGLASTPEEISRIAAVDCERGTTPRLVSTQIDLACPLLMPMRATLVCEAP